MIHNNYNNNYQERNPIVVIIGILYLLYIASTEGLNISEIIAKIAVIILFILIMTTGLIAENIVGR